MNIITRKANANALRQVENLDVLLFEGEVNAHKFIIEPVEGISFDGATIVGTFLRADNQRVQVETGAVVDSNAEITLTANCYAVPGRYRWTVYMVTADETACIYAACGTVQATQGSGTAGDTEPIIEPAAPDLSAIEYRLDSLEATTDAWADVMKFLAARVNKHETNASVYLRRDTFARPALIFDRCDSADRIYEACVAGTPVDVFAIQDGQNYLNISGAVVERFDLLKHKRSSSGYGWKTFIQEMDEDGNITTKTRTLSYMFPQPNYIIWLTGIDNSYAVCVGHTDSENYPKKNHIWIAKMED